MSKFWQSFNEKYQKHKVYVAKIYGGANKGSAGGFYYSWTPGGKIVGRIASGIDKKTLRDMSKNPRKYEGRVAKVISIEKSKKKVLVKPEFQSWAA